MSANRRRSLSTTRDRYNDYGKWGSRGMSTSCDTVQHDGGARWDDNGTDDDYQRQEVRSTRVTMSRVEVHSTSESDADGHDLYLLMESGTVPRKKSGISDSLAKAGVAQEGDDTGRSRRGGKKLRKMKPLSLVLNFDANDDDKAEKRKKGDVSKGSTEESGMTATRKAPRTKSAPKRVAKEEGTKTTRGVARRVEEETEETQDKVIRKTSSEELEISVTKATPKNKSASRTRDVEDAREDEDDEEDGYDEEPRKSRRRRSRLRAQDTDGSDEDRRPRKRRGRYEDDKDYEEEEDKPVRWRRSRTRSRYDDDLEPRRSRSRGQHRSQRDVGAPAKRSTIVIASSTSDLDNEEIESIIVVKELDLPSKQKKETRGLSSRPLLPPREQSRTSELDTEEIENLIVIRKIPSKGNDRSSTRPRYPPSAPSPPPPQQPPPQPPPTVSAPSPLAQPLHPPVPPPIQEQLLALLNMKRPEPPAPPPFPPPSDPQPVVIMLLNRRPSQGNQSLSPSSSLDLYDELSQGPRWGSM